MYCFEVLDVFFGGLEAFPVAWTSFIERDKNVTILKRKKNLL
jgi:hypothetical protein